MELLWDIVFVLIEWDWVHSNPLNKMRLGKVIILFDVNMIRPPSHELCSSWHGIARIIGMKDFPYIIVLFSDVLVFTIPVIVAISHQKCVVIFVKSIKTNLKLFFTK